MNNIDRADRFIQMAEKFIKIFANDKTDLDFCAWGVSKHNCGTVACHGGYALLALHPSYIDRKDFDDGADAVAKFLGFTNSYRLTDWAELNPEIWGSRNADTMFSAEGYRAFGRNLGSTPMTLGDIAAWYLDVAKRLLEQKYDDSN